MLVTYHDTTAEEADGDYFFMEVTEMTANEMINMELLKREEQKFARMQLIAACSARDEEAIWGLLLDRIPYDLAHNGTMSVCDDEIVIDAFDVRNERERLRMENARLCRYFDSLMEKFGFEMQNGNLANGFEMPEVPPYVWMCWEVFASRVHFGEGEEVSKEYTIPEASKDCGVRAPFYDFAFV